MLFRAAPRLARTAGLSSLAGRRFASSLVFLEQKGGKLNDAALSAVTAAKAVGGDVSGRTGFLGGILTARSRVSLSAPRPMSMVSSPRCRSEWSHATLRSVAGRAGRAGRGRTDTGLTHRIDGLSKVYTSASDAYAHGIAESELAGNSPLTPDIAPLFAKVIPEKSVSHIFGAHTAAGKNIFPRLAGMLEVSMVG